MLFSGVCQGLMRTEKNLSAHLAVLKAIVPPHDRNDGQTAKHSENGLRVSCFPAGGDAYNEHTVLHIFAD